MHSQSSGYFGFPTLPVHSATSQANIGEVVAPDIKTLRQTVVNRMPYSLTSISPKRKDNYMCVPWLHGSYMPCLSRSVSHLGIVTFLCEYLHRLRHSCASYSAVPFALYSAQRATDTRTHTHAYKHVNKTYPLHKLAHTQVYTGTPVWFGIICWWKTKNTIIYICGW